MTPPSDKERRPDHEPPIRRPVLFYLAVTFAFGLLGAAVLALLL